MSLLKSAYSYAPGAQHPIIISTSTTIYVKQYKRKLSRDLFYGVVKISYDVATNGSTIGE
jgi:hypothetical protein